MYVESQLQIRYTNTIRCDNQCEKRYFYFEATFNFPEADKRAI